MKYIDAVELPQGGNKTRRWRIQTKPNAGLTDPDWAISGVKELGTVKWHPGWRRYAFWPLPQTLYEPDCLRDLANFCEEHTKIRKAERIAERRLEKGLSP